MSEFKFGDTVFCETFKKYGVFQCYNPNDPRFCVVSYANFHPYERQTELLTIVSSLRPANADMEGMNSF